MRRGFVYILANKPAGTIYVGVTSAIASRVGQHKAGVGGAFTKRYGVKLLVHVEEYPLVTLAIQREKTLKGWPRAWKVALIEKHNPHWRDLSNELPYD